MAAGLPPVVGYITIDPAGVVSGMATATAAVVDGTAAQKAAVTGMTDAQKASMKSWNKDAAEATSAVTTGLLVVGAGAVAAGIAAVKMGADYQSATERLVTSAGESASAVRDSSGKIVGGIDYVRQGMLDMAGQVGDSAMQLDSAMYVIESGGQHGAAGLEVLRAAAEGAKTENADLTTVADATTSALQDYHLQANQSADTVSKLVAAVGAGKSTFQELAGSLHSVLPVASAAHVSLTDILADEASMTVHGMSADQASQNLAHTIGHLQTTTAAQNKELALLGMNSMQLNDDLGSKGLSGTLLEISNRIQQNMGPDGKVVMDLQTALRGLPPAVQQMGAAVVGGTMSLGDFTKAAKGLTVEQAGQVHQFATLLTSTHGLGAAQKSGQTVMQDYAQALKAATGDSTTLNTALMLTGENTSYVQGAIKSVSGATAEAGGHVKGWSDIQGTFNQKLAEAKDGAEAAAIGMGERLLPMATQLLGYFAAHLPDIEALGNKLVDVALAGGRLMQTISPFLPVIAGVTAAFIAWRTAMTVGMAIEGAYTAAMNIAKVVTLFWTSETEGAAAAQWLLNVAMDANPIGLIVLAVAALIVVIVLLVAHWKQVTEFLGGVWKVVAAEAGRLFSWLGTQAHDAASAVGGAFSWLGSTVHGILTATWNAITGIFHAGVNGAVSIVSGFVNAIVGFFSWLYNHNYYFKFLVDSIKLTFEKLRDDVIAIWTTIATWLEVRWILIRDTAEMIWTAVTSAISQKLDAAWSAITGVWNRVTDWLEVKWFVIRDTAEMAWTAVSSVIGDKLSEAWGHVTGFVGQIADELGGLASRAYQWAANMIGQFAQGILDKIGQVGNAVGGVAGAVAGVLGFHSPPPYGPAADSDQWMPNFIGMLVNGLEAGAPRLASASAGLVGGLALPGSGYSGTAATATSSSSIIAPTTTGYGADDGTIELLQEQNMLLQQIRDALQSPRFSRRAYGLT